MSTLPYHCMPDTLGQFVACLGVMEYEPRMTSRSKSSDTTRTPAPPEGDKNDSSTTSAAPSEGPANKQRWTSPQQRLTWIREAAGLSMAEMAKALGFRGASTYQYYEDNEGFKGGRISRKIVDGLVKAIAEKQFPLTAEQVVKAAGEDIFEMYYVENVYTPSGYVKLRTWSIDETKRISMQGEEKMDVPLALVTSLTDADPEEMIFLKLDNPRLFPGSSPIDYALVDEKVSRILTEGLYLIPASITPNFLLAIYQAIQDKPGGPFTIHRISEFPGLFDSAKVSTDIPYPCIGQLVFRGQVLRGVSLPLLRR